MKYAILLAVVLALLTSSCKKKEPTPLEQLPPITQNGANTFGCLINGEPAYTTLSDNWWADEGVYYNDLTYNYSKFIISARTKNNNSYKAFNFSVNVPYPLELKTYPANIISHGAIYFGFGFNDRVHGYATDSLLPATITFTRYTENDQVGSIISGTFDMYMTNSNGDTLHLTNGRFDIKKQ